jgi:hypothetical protein
MDIQQLIKMASDSGKLERSDGGQVTLGYLRDMLGLMTSDMPCKFDTGHNFGLGSVKYTEEPAYEDPKYGQPAYHYAGSESAYPSSYRGYYSDCTFNACTSFEESTVSHVLTLVNGAIGKSFNGYKGGVNEFKDSTQVWGGSTSHESCGDSAMIIGVEVIDDICILKTKEDEF